MRGLLHVNKVISTPYYPLVIMSETTVRGLLHVNKVISTPYYPLVIMSETTVRGLLHVEIKEAADLPDMDFSLFGGATDAYVKVY